MSSRTAQAEIIIFKIINNEVFFLLLKRNEQKGGFWQPATGGVHEGETLEEAVDRELYEETGVNKYLRVIKDVYYFEFNTEQYGVLKEYVFAVEISPDAKIILSDEHTEMKWCSLEESLELLKYESNKNAFKKLYSLLKA